MKTIKQHLSELKPEHAKLALENANEELLSIEFEEQDEALGFAFTWKHSPQGHHFWKNICIQLENGTYHETQQL